MKRIFRIPLVLFGVLLSASLLGGCNTVEGMGDDLQSGGRAVKRSVQ